jgi:hypothetical protein
MRGQPGPHLILPQTLTSRDSRFFGSREQRRHFALLKELLLIRRASSDSRTTIGRARVGRSRAEPRYIWT